MGTGIAATHGQWESLGNGKYDEGRTAAKTGGLRSETWGVMVTGAAKGGESSEEGERGM